MMIINFDIVVGIVLGWALGIATLIIREFLFPKAPQKEPEPAKVMPLTKDSSEKFNEYLQRRVDTLEVRELNNGTSKEVNAEVVPYLKDRIKELESREKEYLAIIANKTHVPATGQKESAPKKVQSSLDLSP
jgi:hypothetical protein